MRISRVGSSGTYVLGLAMLFLCAALAQAQGGDASAQGLKLQPGIGWGGVGFFMPDRWGLVRSTIVNGTAAEAEPLLMISTKGGEVQFAKQLWLPPNSRLTTVTPILVQRLPGDTKQGLEAEARLLMSEGGRERPIFNEPGILNAREGGFQTAIFAGPGGETLIQMATALREAANLPPTTSYLSPEASPAVAPAWEAIDLVVFANPAADLDAAQVEALRQFVVGGGRLWVDLTRANPDTLRKILGSDWDVAVVDRIGLTDFTVAGPGTPEGGSRVTVDYPIDLVRVVAPTMEVLHSVGGQPATMRKPVGRGTLFVSTLEASAFLDAENKAAPALRSMTGLVREPASRSASEARMKVLNAVASEQIGYSVIGRAPVAIVLGTFTLGLLALGLWLLRSGDLARLGWLAPLLAVFAAIALLGLGLSRQSEVPFTLASAEVVEVAPGQPYASTTTLLSVYTPFGAAKGDAAIAGAGEPAWPDLTAQQGAAVRVTWTGDGRWRLDNLRLAEGAVQSAQRQSVAPLSSPAVATATLDETGLRGQVSAGDMGALEDPVILTPTGKLTVALAPDGAFAAPAEDPLGPEQYFAGTMLGQRQIARQEAYRALRREPRFPDRPVIAGWVERAASDVEVSADAQRRARSLLILPIDIATPAPGARVALPAALLRMRPFRGDKELMSAPIYDERTREWVSKVSNPQTVLMAFEPPSVVRGLRAESAKVTFDLDAPGRPVDVVAYDGGQVRTVASFSGHAGPRTVDLTGDAAPKQLPDGSFVVGLKIGDPVDDDPTDASFPANEAWTLSRLGLSVTGTVAQE